ncbi:hypothetical protein [Kibdelosporangium phytohabitans]|uniref:hypothetical protein n=1 Tax=Kibdelosporangium phytohabitans TaxID=860235 RepID=UPI00146FFC35|nr:hypothetical protein [Kibdelosporangium phytohabitans]MBE1463532.1 hypothetical protein [Kibdelosporangium phytohabitans]
MLTQLRPGEVLHPLEKLRSPAGDHELWYLPDGRLVLYRNVPTTTSIGRTWVSGTTCSAARTSACACGRTGPAR